MLNREDSENITLIKNFQKLKDEILVKDKEIIKYKAQIQKLINEVIILKKELNSIKSNTRGAGRKSRFSEMEKEMIKMYRLQGKTINELSQIFKCSTGLIHKIIKE